MISPLKSGCLNAIHPLTILADPLNGRFSGALYTAWPLCPREVPCKAYSKLWEDSEKFWRGRPAPVGKGMTPDEAYEDLYHQVFDEGVSVRLDPSGKLTIVA
jgi:hypothetical protein